MTFVEYARAVRLHEMAVIDRAIHCLFWLRNADSKNEASVREVADLIISANLPDPNVTRLKELLNDSRRVVKGKKGSHYRLHPATDEELERAVG